MIKKFLLIFCVVFPVFACFSPTDESSSPSHRESADKGGVPEVFFDPARTDSSSLGDPEPTIYGPPVDVTRVLAQMSGGPSSNPAIVTGLAGAVPMDRGVAEVCAANPRLDSQNLEPSCTPPHQDGSFEIHFAQSRVGDSISIWTNGPSYQIGGPDKNGQLVIVTSLYSSVPEGRTISAIAKSGDSIFVGTRANGLFVLDSNSGEHFLRFSTLDGLPSNRISALLIDNLGGIWIGTDLGIALARLNGTKLDIQDFSKENEIGGLDVRSLALGIDGSVWLATADSVRRSKVASGVLSVESFLSNEIKMGSNIRAITPDENGGIWIASNRGLGHLNPTSGDVQHFTTLDHLPSDDLTSVVVQDRIVYVGTYNEGIVRMQENGSGGYDVSMIADRRALECDCVVNTLALGPSTSLWAGTSFGLKQISISDPAVASITTHVGGEKVTAFLLVAEQELWVGADVGLTHMMLTDGGSSFQAYQPNADKLPSADVRTLVVTGARQVLVGFGSVSKIVNVDAMDLSLPTLKTIPLTYRIDGSSDLYSADSALGLSKDETGVWYAAAPMGLFRIDPTQPRETAVTFFKSAGDFYLSDVRTVVADRPGHVMVGLSMGVGLLPGGIIDIQFTPEGELKTALNYTSSDGLVDENVNVILPGVFGDYWIGTSNGFSHLTFPDGKTPTFDNFGIENGLPSSFIRQLSLDSQGRLWIATPQGTSVLNDPSDSQVQTFTTADGLPSNAAFGLAKDSGDGIWIGTHEGLAHVTLVADGVLQCKNYSIADGLPSNVISVLSSDVESGLLWVGTDNGLVALALE